VSLEESKGWKGGNDVGNNGNGDYLSKPVQPQKSAVPFGRSTGPRIGVTIAFPYYGILDN